MKLTICIPSVKEREESFRKLFTHVFNQIKDPSEVQLLYDIDNKEVSIGAKRQRMLEKALGEYVTMIDDDDWVADDYVEKMLTAIEQNPDCVGFQIECSGTSGKTASASNTWKDWADKTGGYDYVRTPYQKTPIKTEIVLAIGYKDMRFGEDYDFSKRLKASGLIKREVYIPEVLYYYRFKHEDPKTKYGTI